MWFMAALSSYGLPIQTHRTVFQHCIYGGCQAWYHSFTMNNCIYVKKTSSSVPGGLSLVCVLPSIINQNQFGACRQFTNNQYSVNVSVCRPEIIIFPPRVVENQAWIDMVPDVWIRSNTFMLHTQWYLIVPKMNLERYRHVTFDFN